MATETTDRIEKTVLLKAPLARVWRALSDSTEFGTWFGMRFDGPFTPGARMRGVIVPTAVNAEVASAQKKYEGTPFEIKTWWGGPPGTARPAPSPACVSSAIVEAGPAVQRGRGRPPHLIEQMEPERLFSFRWHPGAIDPHIDYSREPTTLVAFALEEAEGGVLLTLIESGFDQIPLERRAKAFAGNEQGWSIQMTLIEAYLAHAR
jgi:uncharacterized protein YndB with AHSA1/START domain